QVDSFESDIEFKGITGPKFRAIFIRAPWIEEFGEDVEVLAQIDNHPVAVRSGNLLATSFHTDRLNEIAMNSIISSELWMK
ncbi:MAG: pyridoxal 5'-phosphate synthase glutaminase subunit PdxT, partial [Actinomycetota bacterium]